ncbi:MAG TPA: NAD(P)-dependent oxidoreductase [Ilumatobacter sp.]|nr:NAD(P)-dependent oxidoreductase [Ilumatobacter sp.]
MPNDSDKPRIGFVGLGIMGTPMSGHLVDAGYRVTVFDIDSDTCAALAAAKPGVAVSSSPSELAARSDVVFTMLPDGYVVREVALGPAGLKEGFAAGSLLVDTSSSQPWVTAETAKELAASGVAMVDAPVSGAQWGAEAAELVFMVGGAVNDVERARPMLDVLGRAVFHLGPLGSGHMMKCINNTVTAMTFQATLEGLALGVAAGLDPVAMNDVFNESTAGSWITAHHVGQRILSRTFDDPFRLALMRKDVDIANGLAEQLGLHLPMASLCAEAYREADDEFGENSSLSDFGRWTERRTGVIIASGGAVRDHI